MQKYLIQKLRCMTQDNIIGTPVFQWSTVKRFPFNSTVGAHLHFFTHFPTFTLSEICANIQIFLLQSACSDVTQICTTKMSNRLIIFNIHRMYKFDVGERSKKRRALFKTLHRWALLTPSPRSPTHAIGGLTGLASVYQQ